MPSTESFLRQISTREGSKSTSRRWGGEGSHWGQKMEGGVNNLYGIESGGMSRRKRVMVVVDQTSQANHATMWALTHVANKGDVLTLLHVIPTSSAHSSSSADSSSSSSFSATSLGSLCKASRPEVEVEVLVIQGPKLATVMNQVKKLEVSVLVLGQRRPSFLSCFRGSGGAGDLVDHCINNAECLTIGVRKQSRDMGGYVINTRWQKNFWLLA
ncbi:universal stress protein PHOS32 [Momordica charantia]|uniref:Universal stress protein PHOS32 n=1 Tax=Momordica charantia TaxID=3673 RepID=A0A6J1CJN1_MOMCH|nr:universal stress protein PHOS32 [Momordica charantia]